MVYPCGGDSLSCTLRYQVSPPPPLIKYGPEIGGGLWKEYIKGRQS